MSTVDLFDRVARLGAHAAQAEADRAESARLSRERGFAAHPDVEHWIAQVREAFAGAVFRGFTEGYWERKGWPFAGEGGPPLELTQGRWK